MKKISNSFNILNLSPWPLILSIGLLSIILFLITIIDSNSLSIQKILIFIAFLFSIILLWWIDIIKESFTAGIQTPIIKILLKKRIIFFITSEVIFFFSFFWAFFHFSIAPNIEFGIIFPPIGIQPFNPIGIPLLNSLILLFSGVSLTWSHHAILEKKISSSLTGLLFTILLGIVFSVLQIIEYKRSLFSISDSSYGSSFFLLTGFHGIHVLIGTTFLLVNYFKLKFALDSTNSSTGFDLGAWYWHFVDVVWLFLYLVIYWWGI